MKTKLASPGRIGILSVVLLFFFVGSIVMLRTLSADSGQGTPYAAEPATELSDASARQSDDTEPAPADDAGSVRIRAADPNKVYPIRLSTREWRARLSAFEYKILREEGTEYAFTGALNKEKRKGVYYSRATGQPLFSSEHKYDSRTGWPSFWQPIDEEAVDYFLDKKLLLTRIEITDSSSGSHLGHVFEDGPPPTGLRYCINSASLLFVPVGEEPPALVQDYLSRFSPAGEALPK